MVRILLFLILVLLTAGLFLLVEGFDYPKGNNAWFLSCCLDPRLSLSLLEYLPAATLSLVIKSLDLGPLFLQYLVSSLSILMLSSALLYLVLQLPRWKFNTLSTFLFLATFSGLVLVFSGFIDMSLPACLSFYVSVLCLLTIQNRKNSHFHYWLSSAVIPCLWLAGSTSSPINHLLQNRYPHLLKSPSEKILIAFGGDGLILVLILSLLLTFLIRRCRMMTMGRIVPIQMAGIFLSMLLFALPWLALISGFPFSSPSVPSLPLERARTLLHLAPFRSTLIVPSGIHPSLVWLTLGEQIRSDLNLQTTEQPPVISIRLPTPTIHWTGENFGDMLNEPLEMSSPFLLSETGEARIATPRFFITNQPGMPDHQPVLLEYHHPLPLDWSGKLDYHWSYDGQRVFLGRDRASTESFQSEHEYHLSYTFAMTEEQIRQYGSPLTPDSPKGIGTLFQQESIQEN